VSKKRTAVPLDELFTEHVDWDLLREQKNDLHEFTLGVGDVEKQRLAATGLVSFLDAVMDSVVGDNLVDESEVFGD
jgi:hypothetical protein